jgi:hypothetical protein
MDDGDSIVPFGSTPYPTLINTSLDNTLNRRIEDMKTRTEEAAT